MEDFVTYNQAVKLKELGFNHWGDYTYNNGHLCNVYILSYNYKEREECIPAPTLAQVQKWLREKEIEVAVYSEFDGELRTGQWVWLTRKFSTHLFDTVFSGNENLSYDTYEEALSAGVDRAIELLKIN